MAVKSDAKGVVHCKGCAQRNAALQWILSRDILEGVMYFADDDNTYDVRAFDDIRSVTSVGMLPTGNLKTTGVSSPIIKGGRIVGFIDPWLGGRRWPVDMASIVVDVNFWKTHNRPVFFADRPGYVETRFLEAMKITRESVQLLADNCTQIYVWHTRTDRIRVDCAHVFRPEFSGTNIPILAKYFT